MFESLFLMLIFVGALMLFGEALAKQLKSMKPENVGLVVFLLLAGSATFLYSLLFYGTKADDGTLEPVAFAVNYLKHEYAIVEVSHPILAKIMLYGGAAYAIIVVIMLYRFQAKENRSCEEKDKQLADAKKSSNLYINTNGSVPTGDRR